MMRPYFRYSPSDMAFEELLQDFNIYPNPSSGSLSIESPSAQYVLTTVAGATVVEGRVEGIEKLQLDYLDTGLYILSLQTAQGVSQVKWLKL